MEKVWRPFSVWERRPVTPLNGATSGCFRKKSVVFVNKCKTGNSIPSEAAALCPPMFFSIGDRNKKCIKNIDLIFNSENWHALRLHLYKAAI